MIILYGIPNCDTVKKSRAWFEARGVNCQFHDFRKLGVPEAAIASWIKTLGWEALINKKGTTWRKLDAKTQAGVTCAASATALMLAHPSVIKRPVVVGATGISVGYSAQAFESLLDQP